MAGNTTNFSILSVEETLRRLHVDDSQYGLSDEIVKSLQKRFGPNSVKFRDPWRLLHTIIEPFANWFVLILAIAAFISFWIGKSIEGIVVIVILLINAAIYYAQNYSTNRVLKSLERAQQNTSRVRRNGKLVVIPTQQIVPGDIILIREGVKIPADGRIVSSSDLLVDESVLTGESEHQHKNMTTLNREQPIYDQKNMVFSGTIVSSGLAEFVVTATGGNTEFGRIAKLSRKAEQKSPLQHKIDQLIKQLIIFVSITAIGTFILQLYRGTGVIESIRFILSLSVSAIPEGLPIAVVIIMVFGVRNMAKQKAIIRNMNAVETLGQVTLIATDKTGTITNNKLHLEYTWVPGKKTNIDTVAVKSAEPTGDDELDKLILSSFEYKNTAEEPIKIIAFNQSLRVSGAVWKQGSSFTTYIKGAPEAIIEACRLSKAQINAIHTKLKEISASGFRVLGLAAKKVNIGKISSQKLKHFSFAGLIVLGDSLRPEVKQAVEDAHNAGVDVILLTGDHRETAAFFAYKTGISNKQYAIEGLNLAGLDHSEIRHLLTSTKALGRVLPEHKYMILEALQRTHITAMTGDGINDVPALRRANVGIAVGSGTDAAKEAADMIIVDNNFATIVRAIGQGRAIVSNVRKMLTYVLATNLGEIFTIIGALVINVPLPFTALQILWINVVTDSFTMIPIGLEKPEKDLLKQQPGHPSAPLIEKSRKTRMITMAFVMAITTLGIYYFSLPSGEDSAKALAFITLVVAQWANAINSRSDNNSFVKGITRPNWWLVGGLSIALILQVVIMFTPLSVYLNTMALSPMQIVISGMVFIFILIVGDLLKKLIPIKQQQAVS